MRSVGRLAPLAILLALLEVAWAFGLPRLVGWDSLAAWQATLQAFVAAHPARAAGGFIAVYAGATAVSLPGGAVLTVAAGLLFGTVAGAACAVAGATLGASLLFLVARHALADLLAARGGARLARLKAALQRDGFSYLLALRLIPAVPFWLVNLAPALAGMALGPFMLATLLGIIPGSLVFASIGAGLGHALAAGGRPDLSVILSPPVLLPLLGLAALALLPVAWRRWKAAHA